MLGSRRGARGRLGRCRAASARRCGGTDFARRARHRRAATGTPRAHDGTVPVVSRPAAAGRRCCARCRAPRTCARARTSISVTRDRARRRRARRRARSTSPAPASSTSRTATPTSRSASRSSTGSAAAGRSSSGSSAGRLHEAAGRHPPRRRAARDRCGGSASIRRSVGRRPVGAVAGAGRPGRSARVPGRDLRPTSAGSEPHPVRGVRTTHYARDDRPRSGRPRRTPRAAVGEKLAQLGAVIGTRRLAVDAWIDGAGRARRVVVSVPLSPKSGAAGDRRRSGPTRRCGSRPTSTRSARRCGLRLRRSAQVRPYSTLRIAAATG